MPLDLNANREVAKRSLDGIEHCLAAGRIGDATRRELERNAAYERERIDILDAEIAKT